MNQIFAQLFYEMEKHRDTVLVTLILVPLALAVKFFKINLFSVK